MKKKKVIAAFLSFFMVMTVMSGCGQDTTETPPSSETASESSEETTSSEAEKEIVPTTVSMLYRDNANYPYKPDWQVLELIKEHTGVTLDIQAVPSSDYETKKQLVFNSGNIPDIINTFSKTQDALSGLLLPISDYEDDVPNYKAYIKDHNFRENIDNTRLSDGKYYTLPVKALDTRLQDQQWLVRKDILEKNNLPIPTTLDELHDVGVKLKELYPDSTPITNRFGSGNFINGISRGFGTIAGGLLGDGADYIEETDSWVFAPSTDNWKNMLKYTRSLIADGVLDQEFGTLTSTVYEQKIVQGSTFIMFDWVANIRRYNPQGKENDPDYEVIPIYPLKGTDNNYALKWNNPWGQGWHFPSDLKDRESLQGVLNLIDWGFTDEAKTMLTFGIEGETYKNVDGVLHYLDDDIDYCATAGLDNNAFAMRENSDFLFSTLTKEQIELFDKIAKDDCVTAPNPASPLSIDEMEETKIYAANITDYANSYMEKVIFGKESLDNWDNFVKECENKGSKKLIDTYNSAWENRAK